MRDESWILPPVTLVLGGARSGKSAFAESLFGDVAQPVYLATAETRDAEMSARVAAHRTRRGTRWRTLEEPRDLARALTETSRPGTAVLVDCVTLWISNLLEQGCDLRHEFDHLAETLPRLSAPVVLVTNEVGYGIVPDNPLARAFRDHAGSFNQVLAGLSQLVVLVAAGLPLILKNDSDAGLPRPVPVLMEE